MRVQFKRENLDSGYQNKATINIFPAGKVGLRGIKIFRLAEVPKVFTTIALERIPLPAAFNILQYAKHFQITSNYHKTN